MKKIVLLVCFLVSVAAFAQHGWTEGTLHLKNGVVKKGLIKFPQVSKDLIAINGKQRVRFKSNKKAKRQKYDHTQVEKVVFTYPDSEVATYKYIAVSKKKYELFKIIVSGKATLYARSVSYTRASPPMHHDGYVHQPVICNFEDYDEFYVHREGEKIAAPLITLRISRSFRKRAMEYFSDCSNVVTKLKERDYRKQDIETVVKAYNNCK